MFKTFFTSFHHNVQIMTIQCQFLLYRNVFDKVHLPDNHHGVALLVNGLLLRLFIHSLSSECSSTLHNQQQNCKNWTCVFFDLMWQCCHLTKGHLLRWLHLHLLWRFVFILRKRFNWPQFGKQPALALSKFQNAQQANRQTSKQKVHLGLVHRQQTNKQTKSSPWSCSSCCSCCRPPSLLAALLNWGSPEKDQS